MNNINLDYTISDQQGRVEMVEKIIETADKDTLTPKFLESLSDYVLFAMDKQQKKSKEILTPNRKVTVDKRETSYEELGEKLVCGEEEIQNFIANDKNIIFNNVVKITEKDIETIPTLKELVNEIEKVKEQYNKAEGKRKALLKKQIIQMCKDQYVLKSTFNKPFFFNKVKRNLDKDTELDLSENIYLDEFGDIKSDGLISLVRKNDVAKILKNYDKLKNDSANQFGSDVKWIMNELSGLINKLDPLYKDLTILKIQGMQNIEIQRYLKDKYGIEHSLEYLSSLWKHKIPNKIAEMKKTEWLIWYYENYKEEEDWKMCTKCKVMKPRHNRFFSKNKTSKDGLYSICKCCRNNK